MAEASHNERDCGVGCGKLEIPTEDEIRALDAMRKIKEKVRNLRKRISQLSSSGSGEKEEIESLENEIGNLKDDWKGWEEKRIEAARQRMILLGHEKCD